MYIERRKKRHVTSFQIIIIGFLAVILLGSLILMLPAASRTGKSTNFPDALFTATSAVCVTGPVVRDTAAYWSFFGQAVILLLIQIGGMGVVTITVAVAYLRTLLCLCQEKEAEVSITFVENDNLHTEKTGL